MSHKIIEPRWWRAFYQKYNELMHSAGLPSRFTTEPMEFIYFLMHGESIDMSFDVRQLDPQARRALMDLTIRYVAEVGDPGFSLFGRDIDEWIRAKAESTSTNSAARTPHLIPIDGARLSRVSRNPSIRLDFSQPTATLTLYGDFHFGPEFDLENYSQQTGHWITDVLETLVDVPITRAAFNKVGELRLKFSDRRVITVPDGPFETWWLQYPNGSLHGGVGTVA